MTVHLGERTDRLADELASMLATPPPDPLAQELVVVPAKGVERWLTQRLSRHLGVGARGADGVCAGVSFVSPRSLLTLLTGTERTDPWDPDRLVWTVLDVIDANLTQAWCATLARHLGQEHEGEDRELRRDRRWSLARRLAGLFASYAVQRPQLVADWSAGRDLDGAGSALDEDLLWQSELWRRVAARIDAPTPAQRHQQSLASIAAGADLALPDRLSLFGHTRLPTSELELLRAVARVRDVHLWLPTASTAAWTKLAAVVASGPVRRREDLSGATIAHPLLSSLGRDSRELQRSLTLLGTAGDKKSAATAIADPVSHPNTLLGWLQADLSSDTAPDASVLAQRVLVAGDRSVQVHAAHGAARQVEVLREVLVGLLQDDPSLQPRDILVMCPDIDAYAPLVQAGFGLAGVVPAGHPAHRLRVKLADRGLAATNPFLAVAAQIVAFAGGRATLTQVLDLAASAPVRHRFGFGDDDLATVTGWSQQAGVRWGLNEHLRSPYQLQQFPQNTWRAGLDRLLVGVAMAEGENLVGNVLPLDDVASASVDLAGRLAEYVERVETSVTALGDASELADWVRILHDAVMSLGSAASKDSWQVAQFTRELATVAAAGKASQSAESSGTRLRLADLRAVLEERSGARPTRANFRTGSLTVCTMVPMRSVPHRVVCLVGLDDGLFPRAKSPDGDDVLARDPLTGERDVRSEDRQLLLDAVLAATERLVITYTGANGLTGQDRPPCVPLGELLDALDTTTASQVRSQVLVRHPLQPFDERNLTPGGLAGPEPFSFDRAALRGAQASAAPHRPATSFLAGPLPAMAAGDVALADLRAFFAHPVKAFLRQRLDVAVSQELDEPDDAMPLQLDPLATWNVGDRLLRRLLNGTSPAVVFDAELRRGDLPPGTLGDLVIQDIATKASTLVAATAQLRQDPPATVGVAVDLGGGRRVTGVVSDVRADRIVRVSYSSLGPKHRLTSWIDLLALTAARPEQDWSAWTVGWHSQARAPRRASLGPLETGALELLHDLVEIYDRGMREPLPLSIRTGHAWAQAARQERPRWKPAAQEWEGSQSAAMPGEREEREHVLAYGPTSSVAQMAGVARDDEQWNNEPSRLGRYAVRVWDPLFDHERVGAL
jgi:exodeoxyribonuclease V gamma subunit